MAWGGAMAYVPPFAQDPNEPAPRFLNVLAQRNAVDSMYDSIPAELLAHQNPINNGGNAFPKQHAGPALGQYIDGMSTIVSCLLAETGEMMKEEHATGRPISALNPFGFGFGAQQPPKPPALKDIALDVYAAATAATAAAATATTATAPAPPGGNSAGDTAPVPIAAASATSVSSSAPRIAPPTAASSGDAKDQKSTAVTGRSDEKASSVNVYRVDVEAMIDAGRNAPLPSAATASDSKATPAVAANDAGANADRKAACELDVSHQFNEPAFSDMTVVVGSSKQRVLCHRMLLAAASPVFEALVPPTMKAGSELAIEPTADAFESRALYLCLWAAYLSGRRPLPNGVRSHPIIPAALEHSNPSLKDRQPLLDVLLSHIFGVFYAPDAELLAVNPPGADAKSKSKSKSKSPKAKSNSNDSAADDSAADSVASGSAEDSKTEIVDLSDSGAITLPLWDYEIYFSEAEKRAAGAAAVPLPPLSALLDASKWAATRNEIRLGITGLDSIAVADTRFGVPLTIVDMNSAAESRRELNLPGEAFASTNRHMNNAGFGDGFNFGAAGVAPPTAVTTAATAKEKENDEKSGPATAGGATDSKSMPVGLEPPNPLLRESAARTRRKGLALAVLKYAKKFDLQFITNWRYLQLFGVQNAVALLEFPNENGEPLSAPVLKYQFVAATARPSFLSLRAPTIRWLAGLQSLHAVKEIDVFVRIVHWARAEAARQKLPPGPISLRAILADILPLIRFGVMSVEDVSQGVTGTKIFSDEQLLDLFLYTSQKRALGVSARDYWTAHLPPYGYAAAEKAADRKSGDMETGDDADADADAEDDSGDSELTVDEAQARLTAAVTRAGAASGTAEQAAAAKAVMAAAQALAKANQNKDKPKSSKKSNANANANVNANANANPFAFGGGGGGAFGFGGGGMMGGAVSEVICPFLNYFMKRPGSDLSSEVNDWLCDRGMFLGKRATRSTAKSTSVKRLAQLPKLKFAVNCLPRGGLFVADFKYKTPNGGDTKSKGRLVVATSGDVLNSELPRGLPSSFVLDPTPLSAEHCVSRAGSGSLLSASGVLLLVPGLHQRGFGGWGGGVGNINPVGLNNATFGLRDSVLAPYRIRVRKANAKLAALSIHEVGMSAAPYRHPQPPGAAVGAFNNNPFGAQPANAAGQQNLRSLTDHLQSLPLNSMTWHVVATVPQPDPSQQPQQPQMPQMPQQPPWGGGGGGGFNFGGGGPGRGGGFAFGGGGGRGRGGFGGGFNLPPAPLPAFGLAAAPPIVLAPVDPVEPKKKAKKKSDSSSSDDE